MTTNDAIEAARRWLVAECNCVQAFGLAVGNCLICQGAGEVYRDDGTVERVDALIEAAEQRGREASPPLQFVTRLQADRDAAQARAEQAEGRDSRSEYDCRFVKEALADIEPLVERVKELEAIAAAGDEFFLLVYRLYRDHIETGYEFDAGQISYTMDAYDEAKPTEGLALAAAQHDEAKRQAWKAARPAREMPARLRCPVCGDEVSCDACWAREARREEAEGG